MSTRRPTLTAQLRALSRHEHSDLSIGGEAADVIEGLVEAAESAFEALCICDAQDGYAGDLLRAALAAAKGETT